MRKYYKPCNIRKRDVTANLSTPVDPWLLLGAFMRGAYFLLPAELLDAADHAITHRSVESYLRLSKMVDDRTQQYSIETPSAQVLCERQLACLLKKYPFSSSMCDLKTSPRDTAVNKWSVSEVMCEATNTRLSGLPEDPSWLQRARLLIEDVLGPLSPSRVMKIISGGMHGPGSTLSSQGNRVSAYYKYADFPYTCTRKALPYAYAAISSNRKWMDYIRHKVPLPTIPPEGASLAQIELMYLTRVIEVEDSDKITFVPKDCQTDRPIAIGASLNIFLQLGVKAELEECLKRFGVDLTDQTKNQRFAFLGSAHCLRNGEPNKNQFSTIDLASASDTISFELVRKLLPSDWFAFLSDLRHDSGMLPDGSLHHYHKFSAMGNGYTFPLESLLFFCICKAAIEQSGHSCTPNDIAVFGDDIIVRYKHIDSVINALHWSGFEVNTRKSFISGAFKESCGTDYFRGDNVRPFYLKRVIRTIEDVYFAANSVLRKFSESDIAAPWAYTLYEFLVSHVPERLRSYGPLDFDSSYLSVPFKFVCSKKHRPFLSSEEMDALDQARMAGEFYQNSPVVIRTLSLPVHYRARQDVLYLLKLVLMNVPPSLDWRNGALIPRSESVDYATRRESIRRLVKVSSVPNWDAELPSHFVNRSLLLLG